MKDIDGYVTKDNLYRVISRIKYKPDIVVDNTTCNIIIEAIYAMPKADVQPVKHGHWEKLTIVPATDTGNRILARCSKCGDTVFYTVTGREITLKYCPNCGARMDLKDGDTNG